MTLQAYISDALSGLALPSPPWRRIGGGVWGIVFDLGDKTVLKLVKHRGGIGSGAAIHEGETRALSLLGGLGGRVRTAKPVASGTFDPDTEGLADFCGWIRMAYLPGTPVAGLMVQARDSETREELMRRTGEVAAQFHAASKPLAPRDPPLPAVSQQRLLEIADIVGDMRQACGEVAAVLSAGPQHRFLHGDINGGNVLLTPGAGGLVDLGEVQSGPIEIELRHARDLGGPADAMLRAYCNEAETDLDPNRLAAAFCLNALGTLAIATLGTVPDLDPAAARGRAREALSALS